VTQIGETAQTRPNPQLWSLLECCDRWPLTEGAGVPELMGISHIDLTVSDCDRAAAWWQDVVGFTPLNRTSGETFETRSLVHPSGVVVTVMTHDGTSESGAFDERRVGLDHLAFRVADRDELQRWVTHLDAKAVTHSGIVDIGWGPTVVFRDPENTQLELFVHPSLDESQLDAADSEQARRVLQQDQSMTDQSR
jgi:catechol-2,3-dioxygenase